MSVTAAPVEPSGPTDGGAAATPARDRVRARVLALALIVVPIVFLALRAWQRRWTSDDGFINLRIVDNVLHGRGLVYNPGERVEAGTSPLWLAMLAVGDLVTPIRLEYLAVVLGIAASVAGAGLAAFGAARLARPDGKGVFFPVGLLVIAAVSPFWDFASGGLESGIVFLWIGGCLALLAARLDDDGEAGAARPWYVPFVLGIGPLVRPDLAIYSVVFLVGWFVLRGRRGWLRALVLAFALPFVYEVFRAGYFGALVPNTALAKEGGSARWGQGWDYLWDFVRPYGLYVVVPVLLLSGVLVVKRGRPRTQTIVVTFFVAAALHGLYFVRVGGDYMHGRLLLPACFAIAAPVAVVRLRGRELLAGAALVVWAIACAAVMRPAHFRTLSLLAIGDHRSLTVAVAKNPHPVTTDDFRVSERYKVGVRLRDAAAKGETLVLTDGIYAPPSLIPRPGEKPTIATLAIGLTGYVAGPHVDVFDRLGLADWMTARFELNQRGTAGHEKLTPPVWMYARIGDPPPFKKPTAADREVERKFLANATPAEREAYYRLVNGIVSTPASRRQARHALQCGGLADLHHAVGDDLSVSRFFRNIVQSPRLTLLRVSPDPEHAERALCR
jgi:arabinofuranosyltransferase